MRKIILSIIVEDDSEATLVMRRLEHDVMNNYNVLQCEDVEATPEDTEWWEKWYQGERF